MKQYRLIKPFPHLTGVYIQPQLLTSRRAAYFAGGWTFDPSLVESNTEYFEEVKPERWKPEEGEQFWFVCQDGMAGISTWQDSLSYLYPYSFGNCFQTEEQAREASVRVQQTLMDYQDELMEAGK